MSLVKFSDIPGFREAIKRENDIRDAAFLDLTTNICGVEIRQMTPRDMLILEGVGNPLMTGGLPSPAQLADFLWKLSPRYREGDSIRRFLFGRSLRRMDFISAVRACAKYMDATFQDAPTGSGLTSTPYAGWCAHLVHNIASAYGWRREEIMRIALKELFQYLKCIRRSNDPRAPMDNPSDKVKGDHLRLTNARRSLVNLLKRRMN